MRWLGIVAGLAAAWAVPALGQQVADPAAEATAVEDVVVEGRALGDAATAFVETIAAPAGTVPQLARWHDRVCVGVLNFRSEYAQALIDRVSTIAAEFGLEPAGPRCRPGIVVIMAIDGDEAAREIVAARRRQFRTGIAGSDMGRDALERFQTSGHAVRWWHVSQPVDADSGEPAERVPGSSPWGQTALVITGPSSGNFVTPSAASRLRASTRSDLRQVTVIVDVEVLSEVSLDSLAELIAMVGLAQIDPDARTAGLDTILNLATTPATAPVVLTDWDRAYLSGLYGSEQDNVTASRNLGEVADGMVRDLRAHLARDVEP